MEEYYKHLIRVQNQYTIIDMVTITGMMDKTQQMAHLLRYAERVNDSRAIDYCKIIKREV